MYKIQTNFLMSIISSECKIITFFPNKAYLQLFYMYLFFPEFPTTYPSLGDNNISDVGV